MYFLELKNTAHPPIIGALGHSTDCIVFFFIFIFVYFSAYIRHTGGFNHKSNNEKNSGYRKKLLAMLDKFNCSSLSNFNFAREREF